MEQRLELLHNCPGCWSSENAVAFSCVDQTFSKSTFNVASCHSCGLLFTNPRPNESDISDYYNSPDYVSHSDTQWGVLFRLYQVVKKHTLKEKRRFIDGLTTDYTILDYGAGSGDFCREMSSNGWKVFAFEPNDIARALIANKSKDIILVDRLDLIPDNSVSVITLWHVLEHVHQIHETISQLKRILKPAGKLLIAVPNHKSFDASYYGVNWAAFDVPRHLYHFDYESLSRLMTLNHLKPIGILPMWFDSFYVCLLSEKYLCASQRTSMWIRWPTAILIGLISNVYSVFSTKRCSSITYTFESNK